MNLSTWYVCPSKGAARCALLFRICRAEKVLKSATILHCLIYGVSDVFRRKMGHPANQQHLLQFVGLLKGSDFGKAHFPRDLMHASHFPRTASTSSVEVLTTNAAKVGRSF